MSRDLRTQAKYQLTKAKGRYLAAKLTGTKEEQAECLAEVKHYQKLLDDLRPNL